MTGLICLDKPSDITSFLAVSKVRRMLGEKKAGHTGTLDPMATGVLPIALGGATRFIELLPSHDKAYIATVRFGVKTDTGDVTGQVTAQKKAVFSKEDIEKVIPSFMGEIFQTPPMYSAIVKDGVRMYELARKGIEVEREARKVMIKKLDLLDFNVQKQEAVLNVQCSAGTYIRSLAVDIANKLDNFAALTELRRTVANGFSIENSFTLDEVEAHVKADNIEALIIPVEQALKVYQAVTVSPAQALRFSNGGELSLERIQADFAAGYYRVYAPDGVFLGVGETDFDTMQLKVKRVYQG